MTVYEIDFDDEIEPMDYEHTYLEAGSTIKDTRQEFSFEQGDSFSVPSSFLEKPYGKVSLEANNVLEKLKGVSLTAAEPEEKKAATPLTPDLCNSPASSNDDLLLEETNPVVLYGSNSQPRQESIDYQGRGGPTSSAGQTDIPTTPTLSVYSPVFHQHQGGNTHNHDHRVYTYYAPPPIDPMMETEAKIRFSVHIYGMVAKGILYSFFACIGGYGVLFFYKDVQDKIASFQAASFILRDECSRNYATSRCEINMYPALYERCQEWEHCLMAPIASNRTKAIAQTFAEFVDGLAIMTPKAMAFLFVLTWIFGWIAVNLFTKKERQAPQPLPRPPSPPLYVPSENTPRLNIEPLPQ